MDPLESREHEPMRSSSDEEEDSNIIYAFQISGAVVFPMVMQAATELKLLDIISEAGSDAHLSAQEIVSHLPTNNPDAPDMVDRILRLLASYSILTCTLKSNHEGGGDDDDDDDDDGVMQRLYGLSPVSKYYIGNHEGISLAVALQMYQDKVFIDSWYALKDAVLEGGIPFNKVHGMHAFEYPSKDPKFNLTFNNAMIGYTTLLMNNVLHKYKGFEEIKELVDVGGGLGLTLSLITSKYPTVKAINFDLPHVIQHAPPYPGVQHLPGDMFVSIPNGDAILLKCVLHDWSDEQSLKILRNCYAALPKNGKVIVIELIVPEAPETSIAAKAIFQTDLMMMTQHLGGKERTKRAFESLSKKAGFEGIRFECCVCNYSVMEFYK